jgi:hypothetical protein
MAAENIVNTYDSRRNSASSINKQSGTFYNGHKVINDPIHVCAFYSQIFHPKFYNFIGPYYFG